MRVYKQLIKGFLLRLRPYLYILQRLDIYLIEGGGDEKRRKY